MNLTFSLLFFAFSSAFFASAQSAHTLWYAQPAQYFEETLVLGNGKTGASVFGGVETDKIFLNDATLWSGEPVDANMNSASEVRRQGLNATEIAGNLQESGCKTSILILDACRNSPFEKGMRGVATRGLAPMQAGEDSLIAFAADAGQVADDNRSEQNGLYTQEVRKHLKTPGIPI